jgi:hypothetical protein
VRDSARAPVADAEVSILKHLVSTGFSGRTDAEGTIRLTLPLDTVDYEIVVRRIGFRRTSRFVAARTAAPVEISIVLARAPQQLAPVTVNERESFKVREYYIDANTIAESDRPFFNAYDIVRKLRPAMLGDRARLCRGSSLWINGARVRFPSPQTVLTEIKPEHVEEMRYVNCWDTSMPGVRGSNALYLVLKYGVAYDPGLRTSVVVDSGPATQARPRPEKRP